MATETVNININAKDNASPALKKVGMNLKEVGEKVSQIGMRMTAAFTLPAVALGRMVLQNEEVKKSLEPVTAEFKKISEELALSLLPVIEEMKPALMSLADSLSTAIAKFDALPTGTKKAIVGFVAVVAAIGPVITIVGQLMVTVGTLQTLLPTLGASLTAFGATATAALAPILPLIAALGVLIALINSPFGQKGLKAGAQLLSMSAGGLGGIVGLFNGKGAAATADKWFMGAAGGLGLLEGRANGGPVNAGQSYIVGERRPEIFTPRTDGWITPSTRGAGGVNVNVSFSSAISLTDEREAARRLAPLLKQAMRLA